VVKEDAVVMQLWKSRIYYADTIICYPLFRPGMKRNRIDAMAFVSCSLNSD